MKQKCTLYLIACLTVCLFSTSKIIAQVTYQTQIGSPDNTDVYNSFALTKTGSLLIGAYSTSAANATDSYLISLNKDGNYQWSKKYDLHGFDGTSLGFTNEGSVHVARTADNGILVCAYKLNSDLLPSLVFFKCTDAGDVLWAKSIKSLQYKTILPVGITEDASGGIIVVYQESFNSPDYDSLAIGVARFDNNVNLSWQKTIYPNQDILTANHYAKFIIPTKTGGVAVCGAYRDDLNNNNTSSILQLDNSGNVISFRVVYPVNSTYGTMSSISSIIENKQNQFTVYGSYYGDGGNFYSVLTLDSNTVSGKSVNMKKNFPTLQYYAKNNSKANTTVILSGNTYLDKDKGLVNIASAFNNDISVLKYDSLTRICPDYKSPRPKERDTTYQPGKFNVSQNKDGYTIKPDNIIVTDNPITVSNADGFTITCSGTAPIATAAFANNSIIAGKNNAIVKSGIYPNPASNFVTITYMSSKSSVASIEIASSDGKNILSQKQTLTSGANKFTINIQSLAYGIYFVKIATGNQQQVFRFVKE